MAICDKYIQEIKEKYAHQPEFCQTVEEVLTSVEPVLEAHPEYIEMGIPERITTPDRQYSFRVTWVDDQGKVQVNNGYRIEFNNALGPYKGGLRFSPTVYPGILKFLGFEQIFKNSLTGLPIGGGKGGADFDPKGKSDGEVMRFCQSFMTELYSYIGPDTDVPAGDMGVGGREIGYLFGQYKRLTHRYDSGVLTGKPLTTGGLLGRSEATGYGVVWFLREMLKHNGDSLKGKTVVVSGYGNVTWGTIKKLNELGAKVITISGSEGYILDPDGISGDKVDYLLELRASNQRKCSPYAEKYEGAKFFAGEKPWNVPADIYIPCATQNEITLEDARNIVKNGGKYVCEAANMPSTNEAIKYLQENGIFFGPAKAANAGGVACSCIEMTQGAEHRFLKEEEVYEELEQIMINIHKQAVDAADKYGLGYNLVAGANIAGFEKVAEAMMAQGLF
ncbi:MAG: NADP-specific glutamate dehydrogenase [Eubacteriales bacterium]|nr:NADP-specific glutamate dehydrogenase [Eubacteriales bacterium]